MTNKRKRDWIIPVLIVSAFVLLVVATQTDYLSVIMGGDDGILSYPDAVNSKVYSPIYGRIVCTNEGLPTFLLGQSSFVEVEYESSSAFSFPDYEYRGSNYHWVNCPAKYGEDCQVEITNFKCDYEDAKAVEKIIQVGRNSQEQTFTGDIITIPSGKNEYIEIGCAAVFPQWLVFNQYTISPTTSTASYSVRTKQMQLELQDPNGITRFGFISGTQGCKLVSRDAETLKDIQLSGDSNIEGVEEFSLGDDYNIVLGWIEESGANINPLGSYEQYDYVSCKPYTGLYSLKEVYTEGGKTYFVQDKLIESYASRNSLCCGDNQCTDGYVCKDYFCVEDDEADCELGECNPNFYVETQDCVDKYKNGEMIFQLVSTRCDSEGCVQKTVENVECCRDYCIDTMGNDYYCDYYRGCIYIDDKDPCPSGRCCLEGFSHEPRACSNDMICCVGQNDGGNGKDVGICKNQCGASFDEICYDGVDNDGDGMIDESDCIVDCDATPDAEECKEQPTINWFILITSVIGGVIGGLLGLKWTLTLKKRKALRIFLIIVMVIAGFFLFLLLATALSWVWDKIVGLLSGDWLG